MGTYETAFKLLSLKTFNVLEHLGKIGLVQNLQYFKFTIPDIRFSQMQGSATQQTCFTSQNCLVWFQASGHTSPQFLL